MIGIKAARKKAKAEHQKKQEDAEAEAERIARANSLRSKGQVLDAALADVNPHRATMREEEILQEEVLSWRTCRGCWRLSCIHIRRKIRRGRKALKKRLRREFRQIGIEKTPTFIRLARLIAFAQLSFKKAKARVAHHLGEKWKKVFGEPPPEQPSHKKAPLTGERILIRPQVDSFSLASFVIYNKGEIIDFFELDESEDSPQEIGAGGSANVYKAKERQTHIQRAIKRITKKDVGDEEFLRNEVDSMKKLDHPNICKLFEIFETAHHIYLVMELCEGGDLLDKLLENTHLSEPQAGIVAKTLMGTVNYIHSHDICHRDIKPENVLFRDANVAIAPSQIRLVDFGYSRVQEKGDLMYTKVGSPYYVAPEVLNGDGYTKASDAWSIGVTIYMLLCGYPPFAGQNDAETLNLVKQGKYVFPREQWKIISRPAKHLISHLIDVEPKKRIPLKRALQHPWVRAKGMGKLEKMQEEVVDRLITFHKHHALRRAAMLAIAYQLEAHEIVQLRDLYHSLDLNGDGLLARVEFMKACLTCGVDEGFVQEMIKSVDADASGYIDYSEFMAATLTRKIYIDNHAAVLRAFRSFDQDNGMGLSMEELQDILHMDSVDEALEIEQIFKHVDLDGDGQMDYLEFHTMLDVEPEGGGIPEGGFHAVPDDSGSEHTKSTEEKEIEDEFDTHIDGHDHSLEVTDEDLGKKHKESSSARKSGKKSTKKSKSGEGESKRGSKKESTRKSKHEGKHEGHRHKSKKSTSNAQSSADEEEEENDGAALVEAEIDADKEAEKEEEEEAEEKAAAEAKAKGSARA